MRKNFIGFTETITAEHIEKLKQVVGDTKVGYVIIVLVRDLEDRRIMPAYKVFANDRPSFPWGK